ncbi:MAG: ABC transporter ATP-binding protein [Halanaerobiales bacterium]
MSILKVENVSKAYEDTVVFDDYSFEVDDSGIYVVAGPNGAGKTTLFEMIIGLRLQDKGSITILGEDNRKISNDILMDIGVQLQESGLRMRLKVKEEIDLYRKIYGETEKRAQELIKQFGMKKLLNNYCGKLSGGQKRRLLLLLATIHKPHFLLLDEPTSGMDPQARYNTWNFIKDYVENYPESVVVMSLHNLVEAQEYADYINVIDKGGCILKGRPVDILNDYDINKVIKLKNTAYEQVKSLVDDIKDYKTFNNYILIYPKGDSWKEVTKICDDNNISYDIENFNLETLFLKLTGYEYK